MTQFLWDWLRVGLVVQAWKDPYPYFDVPAIFDIAMYDDTSMHTFFFMTLFLYLAMRGARYVRTKNTA